MRRARTAATAALAMFALLLAAADASSFALIQTPRHRDHRAASGRRRARIVVAPSSSSSFGRRRGTTTSPPHSSSSSSLSMALDDAMMARLDGIRRSYRALTERLGDPDVIADSGLLRRVMQDRSRSEDVVLAFDEYCRLDAELAGARELFQEAGDDAEMREMARSEMRSIESELEALENKIKILSLPRDPNDERNCMLEIRAGTGGSEANIFAGEILRL